MMTPLTNSQYQSEVQNYLGKVILLFTALWDNAGIKTRTFLNTLPANEIHLALGDVPPVRLEIFKLFSVNYDTERELVQKFSIRELPEIISLKAGSVFCISFKCETEMELDHMLSI
jgi:hypothetical protein